MGYRPGRSNVNQGYLDKKYTFSRKSKKYKTKYFDALKQLFGEIEHDKDCQVEIDTHGSRRADYACDVVEKTGH
jgi:hypothetical protein